MYIAALQPQFLCVSLIDVTREEDRRLSAARRTAALTRQRPCYVLGGHGYFLATRQDPPVRPEGIGLRRLSRRRAGRRLGPAQVTRCAPTCRPDGVRVMDDQLCLNRLPLLAA